MALVFTLILDDYTKNYAEAIFCGIKVLLVIILILAAAEYDNWMEKTIDDRNDF